MKNICIFTNTLKSGGAEKQAVLLAKALNDEYQVWLVVYYGEKVEQKFRDIINNNHIQTVYLSGNQITRAISFYQFIKNNNIDVIFSYLLTTNFIAGTISKIVGVKQFYPGIRNSNLPPGKEKLQRLIQNKLSTKTIYNNYRGLERLSNRGFNSKKALVIPNCIDIPSLDHQEEQNDLPLILSVGRFVKQKDYMTALNVIKELVNRRLQFNYVIVGHGQLEDEIRERIHVLKLDHIVSVVINPPRIVEYYKKADVYFQTSLFEGLSNTVMEAMSYALPCVVTNAGDNSHMIEEGKGGYVTEAKEYRKMVESLSSLIANAEKRKDFGLYNYEKVSENYSLEAFRTRYFNLLEV